MTLDRVPGLALLVQLARTIRVSPLAFLGSGDFAGLAGGLQ